MVVVTVGAEDERDARETRADVCRLRPNAACAPR
jgi:hypothetical protein